MCLRIARGYWWIWSAKKASAKPMSTMATAPMPSNQRSWRDFDKLGSKPKSINNLLTC